jgi:hypothetical protein
MTIDELHKKQDVVTHSLDRQVTYFKQLDDTVKFDHQAIVNISSTIRDSAKQTQETFQEVTSKFEWGSKLRATATAIRELEFALARIETRIDETLLALQFVLTGRVPVNLISPTVLQRILVNNSLSLPEGYELAAGTRNYDLSWYYEFISTAMLGSPTGFLLILSIPLTDVTTQFELYRVDAFPTEIGNKTYVRFHLGNAYFAANVPQRTHLALSENELLRGKGHHELKICPADRPEFSHETKTSLLSLDLQLDTAHEICPRRVFTSPSPPTLLRQESAILFHMA